jgi:epoxyqueuosine reductase
LSTLPLASPTSQLKSHAQQLGFRWTGVCPATSAAGYPHLVQWLNAGYAGEMHYLKKRQDAYEHPTHVLDGVRSLLMLGLPYCTATPAAPQPGQARISRYAWGELDYHDLIHNKLHQLSDYARSLFPTARVRGVVDTAPLLEREFAVLAGLGWIGKHTLLLNREGGSWMFLAALLLDQPLEYDSPWQQDYCGTCTACLDACPTGAFPQPYVLDARRCISYLTIELREAIPEPLRAGIGDWLFGCDICQDVCPWNRRAPQSNEPAFHPRADLNPLDLFPLFSWTEDEFRQHFRHTPLWRAKRRGILRNAAIVLGNQRHPESIPHLTQALTDPEHLVRSAAAWALGQFRSPQTTLALTRHLADERDPLVRSEIEKVLSP